MARRKHDPEAAARKAAERRAQDFDAVNDNKPPLPAFAMRRMWQIGGAR